MASRITRLKTDQVVSAGEMWAVPVPGIGFFPLVIARAPAPDSPMPFAFVYLSLERCESTTDAAKVPPLLKWDRAWIARVALPAFKKERWTRVGLVKHFETRHWPVVPSGSLAWTAESLAEDPALTELDLCSIETTRDEPTDTVIDNTPVSRFVAEIFPRVATLTSPSSLEAALEKWSRNRSPIFWDMRLTLTPIDPLLLRRWVAWATDARARTADQSEPAIPAGSATDKSAAPGHWLAFPLFGGGFGVALIVRRKGGIVIFGDAMLYGFPRAFQHWPTLEDVQHLTPDAACFVGGTSLVTVRDGRWRVLGMQPGFRQDDWVVPFDTPQTRALAEQGLIGMNSELSKDHLAKALKDVLALDPHAGDITNTNHGSGNVELMLAICARHRDKLHLLRWGLRELITPARIAAWRKINAAIDEALRRA